MAKMTSVAPLERCPFGGMVGGYGCDSCGEKSRGDCRGLGAEYNRGSYPIDTIKDVDKLVKMLNEYKTDLT